MWQRFGYVAFVLVCGALVVDVSLLLWQQFVPSPIAQGSEQSPRTAPRQAYTVTMRAESTRSGKTETGGDYTEAMRSDGTLMEMIETHRDGGTAHVQRSIISPSGANLLVDDVREISAMAATTRRSPYRPENCLVAPQLERLMGSDDVSGVHVVVVKAKSGTGERTYWRAPDLNCAAVKIQSDYATLGFSTVKRAVTIQRGEPDPTLFQVPEHYRTVPIRQLLGLPTTKSEDN